MKILNSIMAALALLALAGTPAVLSGCKHTDSDGHGGAHVHKYRCPMHAEVTQANAGNCPKCGMKLVHKD